MKEMNFIFKYCKKDFFTYFIIDILNNLTPLIVGYIFKIIIDKYSVITTTQIIVLLILFIILQVFKNFVSSSKPILYDNLNSKIKYRLQNNIIKKLCKIEISNFDKTEFIEKMNNGLKISNGMLTQSLVEITSTISLIISSIISFVVIFNTSWLFLILIISSCLLNYFFNLLKAKINYKKDMSLEKENIESSYYQSLFGDKDCIKEMKAFNNEKFYLDKVYNKSVDIQKKKDKYNFKVNIISIISIVLSSVFQFLCGLILVIKIQNNEATSGDFFYLLGLYASINTTFDILLNTKISLKQLEKYLNHYSNIMKMDEVNNKVIDFNNPVLECKNVNYKYDNSSFALENINLTFKGNEKVAIIGENGSGKTTLIKLLTGIYTPTSGEILLNNTTISNNNCYFNNIAITFQDYFKYAFDLKTNVCISDIKNIDNLERLKDTIEKTKLDNIIDNLPDGINTYLTNEYKKGVDLSEGQWQRVKISKMIYKDSNIIFMDEPTAAIDAIQEYNLFKMISEITKNKMTFLVSHRIGFAKLADRIIVLDKGKVIEDGTHEELMKRKGMYYNMYVGQVSMYDGGSTNE